jgi:hypothetical protein
MDIALDPRNSATCFHEAEIQTLRRGYARIAGIEEMLELFARA